MAARKRRPARRASAAWIGKLEVLIEACAENLRERLDQLSPETVASIMGIASGEVTSYRTLVPQIDEEGDAPDGAEGSEAPADR